VFAEVRASEQQSTQVNPGVLVVDPGALVSLVVPKGPGKVAKKFLVQSTTRGVP